MVKIVFAIFFTLFVSFLQAQTLSKDSVPALKPIACDCKKAMKLTIGWNTKYGPTVDTKGFGDIQEIPVKDKHSKYYFEKEHNSAWYLLKISVEGELVFDITPTEPTNDYDFLLFKYADSNFCRDFLARKLIPVRSNISRVSDEDSGKTGLSSTAKVEYETRGKGFAYSKSIHVKKGEQYMLVLDNVYDSGKGHTINLHVLRDYTFTGKTIGDDSLPISATVSVVESNGNVIAKVVSNEKTGEYKLTAPLEISGKYSLISFTDNSFFDIKTFFATTKVHDTVKYKPTLLPELKEGKAYKLRNIFFYAGSPEPLPGSSSTMDGLNDILIAHKKMTIRIEGYVNLPGDSTSNFMQDLSEERAATVYNYLVNKGIAKERLSTKGFGGKHPVFFNPENEIQAEKNRRVEIRVISLGE